MLISRKLIEIWYIKIISILPLFYGDAVTNKFGSITSRIPGDIRPRGYLTKKHVLPANILNPKVKMADFFIFYCFILTTGVSTLYKYLFDRASYTRGCAIALQS